VRGDVSSLTWVESPNQYFFFNPLSIDQLMKMGPLNSSITALLLDHIPYDVRRRVCLKQTEGWIYVQRIGWQMAAPERYVTPSHFLGSDPLQEIIRQMLIVDTIPLLYNKEDVDSMLSFITNYERGACHTMILRFPDRNFCDSDMAEGLQIILKV